MHEEVMVVHRQLLAIITELPSEGPHYTAVHPLWSIFIAAVSASHRSERVKITDLLNAISSSNKWVGPSKGLLRVFFDSFLECWTGDRGYRKYLDVAR